MPEVEERPVLWGLVALVAVAVVVGLIAGLAVLGGSRVLGLGDDAASGSQAADENSLYLPKPSKTEDPEPTTTPTESATEGSTSGGKTKPAKPRTQISLSASQLTVSAMQQIDLTGTYPGGEGAVLQVQRFENGTWSDFPVTVSVSNETFATYVQTSQPGENRFRVTDTDSGRPSNEVKVTVG